MKKLSLKKIVTLSVLILLCFSIISGLIKIPVVSATGGITLVQGYKSAFKLGAGSFNVTQTSAPTNGNVNILCFYGTQGGGSANPFVSSITQSGVTWYYATSENNTGWADIEIWYGIVGSSADKNVTISTKGGVGAFFSYADVVEYNGLTATPLDKVAVNAGGSLVLSQVTGTTATTSEPNELCVGAVGALFAGGSNNDQTNPTNNFNLLDGVTQSSGGAWYYTLGYLYKIVSLEGGYSSATSWVQSSAYTVGCIATFVGTQQPNYPQYSSLFASTTNAGASCNFNSTWTDTVGLASTGGYIFSTNNTGSWVNDTWTTFASNPQTVTVTKTLASSLSVVSYRWFANNTGNYWNSTSIQTLTITDSSAPTFGSITGNTTYAGHSVLYSVTISDNVAVSGYIGSWNNSGHYVNGTWTTGTSGSLSGTLNATVGYTVTVIFYSNDTSNNWGTTSTTFILTDGDAPTVSSISTNSTIVSQSAIFSAYWTDNNALSGYIFGSNNTGSWSNQTFATLGSNPAWANQTVTLNATMDNVVSVRWWCNDTANNWADSGVQSFTIHGFYVTTNIANPGGTITPSASVVEYLPGTNITYSFTPYSSYNIFDLRLDGNSLVSGTTSYSFVNLSANHTLRVDFRSPSNGGNNNNNPTPTPSSSTNGGITFQIGNLAIGTVQVNQTIQASLTVTFSGSSMTVTSISVSGLDGWVSPNTQQQSLVLMGVGESTAQIPLTVTVPYWTGQGSYEGTVQVSTLDSFGVTHISTGSITATVGAASNSPIISFIKNPLYVILFVSAVLAVLAAVAAFSRRRV